VIEQAGIIRVFDNSPTVTESAVFLNISTQVLFGGEQGLLGLAFHPNFTSNGYFYVDYVAENPLRTIIARYSVTQNNPNQALKNSEFVVLEIDQPFSNHKGGQLAFGNDGYLYIALGDGGSAGDPFGNAQNKSTLLGKILRINVDLPSQNRNYSIPQDNPYFGNTLGYKEEIYAYGFRNPWRFSFDTPTGRLWVGDVGQDQREEIDLVEKGKNYGWNIMEGTLTYSSGNQVGLELPIWEYNHSEGSAVIGGYLYHGSNLTALNSWYIYGDYGSGKIWALQYNAGVQPTNSLLIDTDLNISSFGVDEHNELYLCSLSGEIYVLRTNVNAETPTPKPTSTPQLTPTQPAPSSPPFTPNPTQNPTQTPSQTPNSSPSPQNTSTTKPNPSEKNTTILYTIIITTTLAVISTTTILIYKKRHKNNPPPLL
jgi:hypothetical protein